MRSRRAGRPPSRTTGARLPVPTSRLRAPLPAAAWLVRPSSSSAWFARRQVRSQGAKRGGKRGKEEAAVFACACAFCDDVSSDALLPRRAPYQCPLAHRTSPLIHRTHHNSGGQGCGSCCRCPAVAALRGRPGDLRHRGGRRTPDVRGAWKVVHVQPPAGAKEGPRGGGGGGGGGRAAASAAAASAVAACLRRRRVRSGDGGV